jgi:hypothetical protein
MDTSKMSRSANMQPMMNRARIMPATAFEGVGMVPRTKRAPANPEAEAQNQQREQPQEMPPMIPEHMIDPILADLPNVPFHQLRRIGPALLKAMRERHVKIAAMKRFEKGK